MKDEIDKDVWAGLLESFRKQEEESSLNKMMTHTEFLEWVKFDDSNSKDEELLETMEFFCYSDIPI